VDVLGQFQTSYDSMCNLISNILHNLAHYQQDATQCDKVNMLILYVSYQHAFEIFWSWIVFLRDGGGSDVHWSFVKHNISMGKSQRSIVWKNILGLEPNILSNTCSHPINTYWKKCQNYFGGKL
jgi:hypothetical protein